MTLGEFRKQTKTLPENTVLLIPTEAWGNNPVKTLEIADRYLVEDEHVEGIKYWEDEGYSEKSTKHPTILLEWD